MHRGRGPGVPYARDAAEPLRDVDAADGTAVRAALDAAEPRDGLTLWHLLARVAQDHRPAVFDALAALVAPPAGVTRAAILALDDAALLLWRDAIR
jgi:hypothetical protein